MKKKYIIGSATAALLLAVGVGAYQINQNQEVPKNDNKVAYIEGGDKKSNTTAKSENKTQEQINEEEGISAEQIVVKITDDGYVTSHGDHYHYYNGKVPFDSLISEDLIMNDPNYTFNEADVVNEVADGYIIKVNGNYYLYLKEDSKRKNVRTKQQIEEQKAKGTQEAAQKKHKSGKKNSQVSQKSDGRYRTDDGYVFSPTDVIEDTGDAFIVPHGDHFHYIPKKDLSPSELAQAQAYWDRKTGKVPQVTQKGGVVQSSGSHSTASTQSSHTTNQGTSQGTRSQQTEQHSSQSQASQHSTQNSAQHSSQNSNASQQTQQPQKQEETIADLLKQLYALPLNKRHVESDGLVYDPQTIYSWTDSGVAVPHGDHYHFIPYSQMSPLEEKITRLLKDNKQSQGNPQPIEDHHHEGEDHSNDAKEATESGEQSNKDILDKIIGGLSGFSWDDSDDEEDVDNEATNEDSTDDQATNNETADDQTADPQTSENDNTQKEMREVGRHLVPKDAVLDESYDYKGWTAQEIYEVIQGKAIVEPDDMLYGLALATEYREGVFIIPHIDHYHYVQLKWIDNEPEIFEVSDKTYNLNEYLATAKYYMENPDKRPKKAGWGEDADIHKGNTDKHDEADHHHHEGEDHHHDEADHHHEGEDHHDEAEHHHHEGEESHPVTPISEREGKPNSQIVYSAKEVAEAKKAGKYTTSDGYIFDPKDIIRDMGDAYITPHMNHEHWIPKADLSESERQAAAEFWASRNNTSEPKNNESKPENNDATANNSQLIASKELDATGLSATEIFDKVMPEKIVPTDKIKGNMYHAVRYVGGQLIIPHLDHYHNVYLSWLDEGSLISDGYSIKELLATVKYYMAHPEEAPKEAGWGTDAKEESEPGNTGIWDNNYGIGEEPDDSDSEATTEEEVDDDEDWVEEEDPFDAQMRVEGERHGLSGDDYFNKLFKLASRYSVALDKMSYAAPGQVTVAKKDGTTVIVALDTLEEVTP
ncbi:pneumococcal-type histidine triad protein [Streptococcus pacificus]|uniref:Pneumococcal-type histidine triad protein n=1 Tax=Streptococcus pacificus TaxID=2740577 RepID=A0ABS0ZJE1_9STRE|nr:pneumococcal-type histidine triad protein [Streptococcus pacificus]MBJ8325833.1 pneumococcal-type histidine triad protein [Streptococcus pacificus]